MEIKKETVYTACYGKTERVIRLGDHVKLVFHDGTYHTGELTEILERVVTISRSDGDYTYLLADIRELA